MSARAESRLPGDDPWISAYLEFRRAVMDGQCATVAQAEDYASQLRQALPAGTPSVPAALFITADIQISFPRRLELMTSLWVPRSCS